MTEDSCEHKSVSFDYEASKEMSVYEIREKWPRFFGTCSCGYYGVSYANMEHYLSGDW